MKLKGKTKKEFEEWFFEKYMIPEKVLVCYKPLPLYLDEVMFIRMPLEMQIGVLILYFQSVDIYINIPKRYEYALIKGLDYIKDRNNYIMMCPSCHRKYDFTEEQKLKISNSNKGRIAHNKGYDSRVNKKCIWCENDFKTYKKISNYCSRRCFAFHREQLKREEQLNK